MLRYRSFRNTDPPAIAAIWRSRAHERGLLQPITVDVLEQFVFGRLIFDYSGLVLAFDEEKPIGFAHATFGPNESRTGISSKTGVVSVLLVHPEYEATEVPGELLARCEAYLRERGAETIDAGAMRPKSAFYVGLYGGADLPGILDSDTVCRQVLSSRGYQEQGRTLIFRQDLCSCRPPVDRQQMQHRRRMLVQVIMDLPAQDWWEACTLGDFDRVRFELVPRGGGPAIAQATFRTMQWSDGFVACPAVGVLDLYVEPAQRRQGVATFLLGEAFRALAAQGILDVEAHAAEDNPAGLGLLRKLGFQEVGQGTVFRKRAEG